MKFIRRLMCRLRGHDWEIYPFRTGYYSYDVEKAGVCVRCGLNTHAGLTQYGESREAME